MWRLINLRKEGKICMSYIYLHSSTMISDCILTQFVIDHYYYYRVVVLLLSGRFESSYRAGARPQYPPKPRVLQWQWRILESINPKVIMIRGTRASFFTFQHLELFCKMGSIIVIRAVTLFTKWYILVGHPVIQYFFKFLDLLNFMITFWSVFQTLCSISILF